MEVSIRKFCKEDIYSKIRWINDERNNRYLHYDLPLEYEKTLTWYERTKDLKSRFDAVIEADGIAVGLIGLLSIDDVSLKSEYYICLGEYDYRGKSIAEVASKQLLDYAFYERSLNRVYLYTEEENKPAQALFEKIGFQKEGLLRNDVMSHGVLVNRYILSILKSDVNVQE